MKTIFAALVIALLAGASQAQPYQRHNPHYHPHRTHDWVGPAIVTGIGTAIIVDHIHRRNRPEKIIIEEVVVNRNPVPVLRCTAWRELELQDGTVFRERICSH